MWIKTGTMALLAGALMVGSCIKQTDPVQCDPAPVTIKAPQAEVTALKQYIDTSGIKPAPTLDDRGFYYVIQKPGSGAKPTVCSTVTVNYEGTLTNKKTFDKGNGVTFPLGNLILGWQEGIPLIAPGGSITLYLPPSLAYGSRSPSSSIPANSFLIFKIDLIQVTN